MSRLRVILVPLAVLAVAGLVLALLFSPKEGWRGTLIEKESGVPIPTQTTGPESGSHRDIARLIPAPRPDSLHPVERVAANGEVLDEETEWSQSSGVWTRSRLIRSEAQTGLLRLVEEWSYDPSTDEVALKRRDLYHASKVIVRTKAGVKSETLEGTVSRLGMSRVRELAPGLYSVALNEEKLQGVPEAIHSLERLSDLVEAVEADGVGFGAGNPDDLLFPSQWGNHNTGQSSGSIDADVDAPEFWALAGHAPGIVIAVLDSGLNFTHPDLAGIGWTNPDEIGGDGIDNDGNGRIDDVTGWDFVNSDNNPTDDHAHGTHVSGIIAAVRGNGAGIAGMLSGAKILPCKILNASNSGLTSDLIAATSYARLEGVPVMNLSLQNYPNSSLLSAEFDACATAGIILCIAAGNQGVNNDSTPNYPSSYPQANILSVGNHNRLDARSSGSNFGATSVDLFAPGDTILSTVLGTSYQNFTGTSMATPYVAAVCGALKYQNPAWGAPEIRAAVFGSVVPKAAYSGISALGGRLNAFDAISDPSPFPNLTLEQPAGISLDPANASVAFGSAPLGGTAVTRIFSLGNSQVGTILNVGQIAVTGAHASDFTVDLSSMDSSIDGGVGTAFTVRFLPSDAGVRNATLVISSDDPVRPGVTVSLAGSGIIPGGPSQQILVRRPPPAMLSSNGAPFEIDAFATSGGPLNYEVLTGPVTINSSGVVTPTGGEGGVTIAIRQPGGGGFDATETYLTFGVGDLQSFTKVVAGFSSWATFAIRDDGTLWTWGFVNGIFQLGDSTSGGRSKPQQIGTATDWIDLSIGNSFGMGLRSDGSLWTWGLNSSGQLGDGTSTSRSSPTRIGTTKNWVSMDAGNSFALAVADDGTLWSWGANGSSQLGQGDTVQRNAPTRIGTASNWTYVTCGNTSAYALNEAGELWAWGFNSSGQLGLGDTITRSVPTRVGSDSDWQSIVGGNSHVVAIKGDGSLWAWGSGTLGQLGHGDSSNRTTPTRVGTQTNWISASAGFSNSGGKTTDGTIWAWGVNTSGQLANGVVGATVRNTPQPLVAGNDWESIDFGNSHTVALRSDGSIWVAGDSFGFSGVLPRALTRAADPGGVWQHLAGTAFSFHAVRQDGTLWHWGRASSGQFGDGSLTDRSVLFQTGTETNWSKVESGGHTFSAASTLALKTDGSLRSSGSNTFGQLGNGTTTNSFSFVTVAPSSGSVWSQAAVGNGFSMGIRNDGTLWGWGVNSSGQIGLGNTTSPQLQPAQIATGTDWTRVSAGSAFAAGIRGGTLWAWGSNISGQVGDGTTTPRTAPVQVGSDTNWVEVACGASHALALKADGSLWVWGNNAQGQLGLGDQLNRLAPVQAGIGKTWSRVFAGLNASAAIAADGTLWTAGENSSGQSGRGGVEPLLTLSQVGSSRNWQHVALGAQNLVAIHSDGSFWVSGTTGPRVMEAGRKQSSLIAMEAKLHAQAIHPLNSTIFPGETIRVFGTSGLPAQVSVLSGPGVTSGTGITVNGTAPIRVRAWQPGDETAWDAAPPEEILIEASEELTLHLDSSAAAGITVNGFQAGLVNLSLSLGYSPTLGDELVIVENTGVSPISGVFPGQPEGSLFYLSHGGAIYGFRLSYAGGDGNDVVITHEQVPQELTVVPVGVKPAGHPAFALDASSNSGLPASYAVISGPATVQGNLVTLTGQPGGVTIKVSQTGNDRFSPAAEKYLTFMVGEWPPFAQVAVSQSTWAHFAIHENGTLWSWGYANGLGQLGDSSAYRTAPLQIGTANNWVKVDVGGSFATGLRADGTLWAWGINTNGQLGDGTGTTKTTPVQVVSSKIWSSFSVGNTHVAAVATDGTLWTWGLNINGQLGLGDTTQRTLPTQLGAEADWSKVFCGGNFTVALKSNGELWAWGLNSNGQLGNGSLNQSLSPVRVGSDSDWADAAGGYSHVLAVKSDGSLWSWGANTSGQLGIGSFAGATAPVRVGSENNWAAVSGSTSGSAAMKADGSLWIWGSNAAGQFGDGTLGNNSTTPRRFLSGDNWTAVEVGGEHAFALREDGMLIVTGAGGNFSGVVPRSLAKAGETGATWNELSGTGVNFHAIRNDGSLWAWGRSGGGQFGDGTFNDRYAVTRIGTESQWISVKTGGHLIFSSAHTIARKSDGTLWGSGQNSGGQIGDSTTTQKTSFVQIGTSSNWSQFDVGTNFTMAVQGDGTLWGWGINGAFQLGQGTTGNRSVPTRTGTDSNWRMVACGRGHGMGIRTDGSLWGWGANNFGQIGDGTFITRATPVRIGTGSDWLDVVCGSDHTMALKTDGSLWVWGNNTYGQHGRGNRIHSPTPIRVGTDRSWIRMAAGRNTSAVIGVDGTLWTAGENHSGQCGDGATTDVITFAQVGSASGWVHVAMSAHSLAAIREDGSIWTAGTTGPRLLSGGRDQTRPLTVFPTLVAQSITSPLSSYPIGQGGFRVTTGSGLPAEVRLISGPATVSGDQVEFTGIGTVTIEAWHPGDAEVWDAAVPEQFSITVTKNPATVTLDGLSHVYDGSAKAALATTNPAGKAVVLTYNGLSASPVGAGSYTVVATIDDPLYQGSATGTLTIAKAPQTILFDPIADQLASANVILSASGGSSGNPVTYSVDGPGQLAGNTLTFTGAGSVTVTANQAGNANYHAAAPVGRTFNVSKAPATVNLGSLTQTYDGTAKVASALTSPAGKLVTFTYDGFPVAPIAAGSYTVIGTIDDPIYQGSASATLVVGKASQTISFAPIPDQLATAQVTLTGTGGGSGNPVTFTVEGPAQIDGAVMTFTTAGAVTVTAHQAGDGNHDPAPSVGRTFQVTKAPATVLLSQLAQTYNGTPRAAAATTVPAGLMVDFTYDGGAVVPVNAGTYQVVGTISDPRYEGSASGTIEVAKAAQVIHFDAIGNQLATAIVNLSASGGGSGNPVTFAVTGGPAQLAGAQMSFTGPGSVTVVASQSGNANFEEAIPQSQTIQVTAATLAIALSRLHQVTDGTGREALVTTSPPGVATSVTYDGEVDLPTDVGSYEVVADSADPRYEGSSTATLVVDDAGRIKTVPGGVLPPLSSLGELTIPTFQIGAYEVTGKLWATVVAWAEAEAGYDFDGAGSAATGDQPVTGVSWYDAAKWCNARTEWENSLLGRALAPAYRVGGSIYKSGVPPAPVDLVCDFNVGGYRLPTAAEWEYAARGGSGGTPSTYPGGNLLDDLGWYAGNSLNAAKPAGGKNPNTLSLYDLAGNAAEWTWDAPAGDPGQRLLRGGAWSSAATACEITALTGEAPALRLDRSGFRVANSVALSLAAALDHPELLWDSGGDEPWFAQTGITHDAVDAAESGELIQGQSSWVETRVEGPGNFRFRWKTAGTPELDQVIFAVDGNATFSRNGVGDWESRDLEIAEGSHVLRWTFGRGSPSGEARAWLDSVEYLPATTASVTTDAALDVTNSSATLGGEVTGDGRRAVSERGVVYGVTPLPALGNGTALPAAASGTGTFTVAVSGLSEGTTYFARAYATNNLGTTYGEQVIFTTDTTVAFENGIKTYEREMRPGDRHRYAFSLDGPRFISFGSVGGAALRARLYDGAGNLLASFEGDGDFLIEELLYAGDYEFEIFRQPDAGGAQAYTLTLDASNVAATRPDVAVGASATALLGAEVYAPVSQASALISTKANAVTGHASFANRGNLPDVLVGSATGGSAFFAVTYLGPEGNITAGLLTGTYETPEMTDESSGVSIRATITPNKKKLTKKKGKKPFILKKTQVLSLRLKSTFDPAIEDAATISVQTR